MTTTQESFFLEHAANGGVLTDAQMTEMLSYPVEGDSAAAAVQSGDLPDTTQAKDGAAKDGEEKKDGEPAAGKVEAPKDEELNAGNAVVLSKSGKYTIEYSKLEEARQRAADAEGKLSDAAAENARLKAQLEALEKGQTAAAVATGEGAGTAADPGALDPTLLEGVDFGDYSDEAMKKAVVQIAQRAVQASLASQPAATQATAAPAVQNETPAEKAQREHMEAIYKAHPDANELHQSAELKNWIATQPPMTALGLRAALTQGTTQDVIAAFSAFKDSQGKTGSGTAGNGGLDAAAAAAIAKARSAPPTSLSEIPAGASAHHNETDAMLAKSSTQLMAGFEGKSPDEIMRQLNRVL